jgi:hypothetical protein
VRHYALAGICIAAVAVQSATHLYVSLTASSVTSMPLLFSSSSPDDVPSAAAAVAVAAAADILQQVPKAAVTNGAQHTEIL